MSESSVTSTTEESDVYTIRGRKVALGPRRREQIPFWVRWLNDYEVTRTLNVILMPGPVTYESEVRWFESTIGSQSEAAFCIYELTTGRAIGLCGLHEIDRGQGTATLGILIGEKDCWNRGYGTEAAQLILDYGFNVLGLVNVMLTVYADNARAVRAYEKAGFKLIGRRRKARMLAGCRLDVLYMDVIAEEFDSPVLKAKLREARSIADGG